MRKVYKSILRLREQEKQEKYRSFSEAEAERSEHQKILDHQQERLSEEREKTHKTMGMIALNDYLNMQRHIEIKESEQKQDELNTIVNLSNSFGALGSKLTGAGFGGAVVTLVKNDKVEELEVHTINPYKFNGCGLVISSEVVRSGVNIPRSVFFVHEDTAFMMMTNKVLGNIPQYVIKNILLVHNRNHPKKRMYVINERLDGTMNEKRRSNEWYVKANSMSEQNYINLFNPNYKSFTWGDVWK